MLSSTGIVKLADLGIAKSENNNEAELTLTQGNLVFGTPHFASPEQCRSTHNADFLSDIYSLGASMFYMAAGEPPYDGATAMEAIINVLNSKHKDLQQLAPHLSKNFVLLVHDMIARDPALRPPSADALKMRIESLLAGKMNFRDFMRIKWRILKSQITMLSSNIAEKWRKKKKKFPKKSLNTFISKAIKIAVVLACIFCVIKYRTNIFNGVRKFCNSAAEVLNLNKKTPPPVKIAAAPAVQPQKPVIVQTEKKEEKTAPAPIPEKKKIPKKVKRRRTMEEINNVTSAPKKKKVSVSKDKWQNIISKRLEKCRKKYELIKHNEKNYNDPVWYVKQCQFYAEQQKLLENQLAERKKHFEQGCPAECKNNVCILTVPYRKSSEKIIIDSIIEKDYKYAGKLIKLGADVNARDAFGRTPIFIALLHYNDKKEYIEFVKLLLLAGADLKTYTRGDRQTPLFYAYQYASEECCELLISARAETRFTDVYKKRPEDYSYVRHFYDYLKVNDTAKAGELLDKHHDYLVKTELRGGITPLQFACINSQADIVNKLLEYGAIPDMKGTTLKLTPLQIAFDFSKTNDFVANTRLGIVLALLQSGADPKVPSADGKFPTLLQYSCHEFDSVNDIQMGFIASLLQYKYNVENELVVILNKIYAHGDAPYRNDHHSEKRQRLLKLLLGRSPDLHKAAFNPLMADIAWSPKITEEEIESLLSLGADINGRDKNNCNALQNLLNWAENHTEYLDKEISNIIKQRIYFLIKKGINKKTVSNYLADSNTKLPEIIIDSLK